MPITLGGAARHNVHNALGVTALALAYGLDLRQSLADSGAFRGTPDENPGRLNLFDSAGCGSSSDFAHNPHGMDALVRWLGAAGRRGG